MGWDDNEAFAKRDDDKTCVVNMNEEELELVQGGTPFSSEQLTEVKGIIDGEAKHEGSNVGATALQATIGTVAAFGMNAAGDLAGAKVNRRNN